jgi:hypothetical protein
MPAAGTLVRFPMWLVLLVAVVALMLVVAARRAGS